jgi:serine/threonine-protein kinase
VSEGFGALVNMHINQAPEPPSRHNPQISPGVERLVLKMLAKNADERFQSMEQVQEALGVEIARAPTYRPGETGSEEVRPRRYSSSATTLSEAAAVASGTVPPRGGSRRALGFGVGAVGIVAVVVIAALRGGSPSASAPAATTMPPPPVVAATNQPVRAPAAAAVPVAPAAVEVVIDSSPEGALVSAEGVAIGTTPMKWQVTPTGSPRTLTFQLAGHQMQTIQAVPAAGMRLRPTLESLRPIPPHSPHNAHLRSRKPGIAPTPVDDIKSER